MSKLLQGAAIVCAAIVATMCVAAPARAADLPYRYRQPQPAYTVNQPLNAYSWAGPYLGGNIGYGWGEVSNNPTSPSGVLGGGQIGYNWQSAQFVVGIEADMQASGADDTILPFRFANNWFGTVRGRAGFTVNNLLLYGTGGLAFGDLRGEIIGLSETHTTAGWTVGAGAEIGLAPNWSAKLEYLFVDLADHNFSITGQPNGLSFSTVRAGVNYHF
jgi:outer membrane immunogenic protein